MKLDWLTTDILFEYFLRNFYLRYPALAGQVEIGYGNKDCKINIEPCISIDFFKTGELISSKQVVQKTHQSASITFFFGDQTQETVQTKNDQVFITDDIVASTFYLLSGYDELVRNDLDKYERACFKGSIVDQCNLVYTPVINQYHKILIDAIELAYDIKVESNNSFCISLSHDIDQCTTGWKQALKKLVYKAQLSKSLQVASNRMMGDDVFFNFSKINQIEQQYQAKSTFFFLPSQKPYMDAKNADYDVGAYRIQKLMASLKRQGHEIGIHGSFGTSTNFRQLTEELKKLKQSVMGNRFHYLMYHNLETPSVLGKAKMLYDSSIGFAEQIGFRRGTCSPFFLFDFQSKSIASTLEIPLLIMDVSMIYEKYMHLSVQDAFENIERLWNIVKRHQGILTILWHNNVFEETLYPGWARLYEQILDKAQKEQVPIKLKGEIVQELLSINY